MADQNPSPGSGSEKPETPNPRDPKEIRHDAFFENMGLDPGQPATPVVCYTGILARGQREGLWMLYLRLDMSEHLEIQAEDIVSSQALAPEQSPFGSLGGSLVCVRKGAQISHVTTTSRPLQAGTTTGSEFDLNVQLGASRMAPTQPGLMPATFDWNTCFAPECGGGGTGAGQTCLTCVSCGDTCFRTCRDTCRTLCDTCRGGTCLRTCDTCRTACGTCATCIQTCGQTCVTCGQTCGATCVQTCQTCQTCGPTCGQTCQTCQTCGATCGPTCGQTCVTCVTCDTCGPRCETRIACTHVTCFRTCDIC